MTADVRLLKVLKRLYDSPRDNHAWGELYKLMWKNVLAEASVLLEHDLAKAQDAAHETLMTLARTHRIHELRNPHAFLSFVSSTVIQECRVVRQRHRGPQGEEGEREEVRRLLQELDETSDPASQQLSAQERDVLEQFVEGETSRDLAKRYDVPEDAAEALVVQARLHLRIATDHYPGELV